MEPVRADNISRAERRDRLRFYEKTLKEHMKNKPVINVDENDSEVLELRQHQLRAWTTRYMVLKAKIDEFQANNKGNDQQS